MEKSQRTLGNRQQQRRRLKEEWMVILKSPENCILKEKMEMFSYLCIKKICLEFGMEIVILEKVFNGFNLPGHRGRDSTYSLIVVAHKAICSINLLQGSWNITTINK